MKSEDGPDHGGPAPGERDLAQVLARKDTVLRLLKDVALAMNEASSPHRALRYVVERVCTLMKWPVGHVYLISATQADLLLPTGIFYFDDPPRFKAFRDASMRTSFREGEGLPGRVMQARVPVWVEDVTSDDNFPRCRLAEDIGITSGFAFPVLVGERLVGVLEFFSSEAAEPDYDLLDAMLNVGAQLGRVVEREEASEAIRGSEEHLRALMSSIVEGVITADADGRITGWAGGAERIFGYTAEEVEGENLTILMPERYIERHRAGMERFLSTGEARLIGHSAEVEGVRRDGAEFPIELSLSTWLAAGRRFFTAVIRDVTDRHEAFKKLREREVMLERAQRIAHLGSWRYDVARNGVEWSDQMCRIFGVAPGTQVTFEEYIGMIHPDDRDEMATRTKDSLSSGESFSVSHRIKRQSDGEERILHCEGEVVTDATGTPVTMIGTALDVTELKRAEANLRERERLFRLLAENMSDAILLQSPGGEVLYASPSTERVLGIAADEFTGRNLFDILHPADERLLRGGAHQSMLEGTKHTQSLVRARRPTGEFVWLELASKPILREDGGVEHILSSARDVSERIEVEEQASRYRSELERRNRELQDFAYVASHDLQEPLRKIRAFSDLLEEDYGDRLDEEAIAYIDRVQDAAIRMSSLITDLLQFSRITTKGEPFSEVDLSAIVEGVVSDLEIAISEAGAELIVGELPTLEADPLQMRQLFQNLLSNALKFRHEDVRPVVRVSATIERNPSARPSVAAEICRITVADNGIGFDDQYVDRIFSPFQRLHNRREYEGTGMGLAICRRIVERHNGTILARSATGKGSTFIIEIPLHQSKRSVTRPRE